MKRSAAALLSIVVIGVGVGGFLLLKWRDPGRPAGHSATGSGAAVVTPRQDGTAQVTFAADIAPVVFSNCAVCHHPGGAGPFSLLTYADVAKRGKQIVKVTQSRFMPPWLPEHLDIHFVGERGLGDTQIAMIDRWVADGAPEGSAADLPPTPSWNDDWQLGKPDLIVQMPRPYTLPAEGADIYRNFAFPVGLPDARYVRAVEFHSGNNKLVHHALIMVDRTGMARRRDQKSDVPGYPGMDAGDGVSTPAGHLLSWQPGRLASPEPEGMPFRLDAGSDFIIQMHMRPSGKPETIQATVGLYFTQTPPAEKPMTLMLRSTAIDIPAGAKDYAIESSYVLPVDVELLSVLPHVHYLGKDLRASAKLPDGTVKQILHIPNWDFNWQSDFRLASRLALPRGTTLSMRYTYDNSSDNPHNPNKTPTEVKYGLQSTDEMGEFWMVVLPHTSTDAATLAQNYGRNYALPDRLARAQVMLAANPNDARAHTGLAEALSNMGKIDDAMSHLRTAIGLQEDYAEAHYDLGICFGDKRDINNAIFQFRTTLKLTPDDYRAHGNLGFLLAAQGNSAEAKQHFEEALRLNPNDADSHVNLSRIYAGQHNLPHTISELEAALRINPENSNVQQMLNRAKEAAGIK